MSQLEPLPRYERARQWKTLGASHLIEESSTGDVSSGTDSSYRLPSVGYLFPVARSPISSSSTIGIEESQAVTRFFAPPNPAGRIAAGSLGVGRASFGRPIGSARTASDGATATADARMGAAIESLRHAAGLRNAVLIADRLADLQGLSDIDLDDGKPLNLASLLSFASALEGLSAATLPTITLSSEGNIYASWRRVRRVFSTHFLSDGHVRWVFFGPNETHPSQTDRMFGQTTSDQLVKQMKNLGVTGWICT